MVLETELRKMKAELRLEMRQGFAELRKMLIGKAVVGSWVSQGMACSLLNVKPRQLRNLRVHLDTYGKEVGTIRWRKGAGKTVEYHKDDIAKYKNKITIGES